MRRSKKLSALVLGMIMVMGMAACGAKDTSPQTTAAAVSKDSKEQEGKAQESKDGESSAQAETKGEPVAGEAVYNWKWGTVDSTSNPNYEAMEYFCKLLDEKAPGKWSIQIYPDSQLGDASQLCESVQMGTLEMACPASSIIANYVPDYGVFDMPYLFTTAEEVDAVLDGQVGTELAALSDSANMKLVAWWEIGFRCLANNARPVNTVDDVKGLRLRVMSNEVHQSLWTALGADPVPMSLSDAYVANQNGTIDGQDNPLHSLIANSTFEVCHYIAVSNHVYSPLGVIVSPKAWSSMPAEDQEIFMECMKEATANQKKLVRDQNEKAAKELEEKGCEVTYPDLKPFADKMEVVYDQYPQFSGWLEKIK